MISKEDYNRLKHLQKHDTETYNMIKRIQESYMAELSVASHNIKNYISFIRSSYQIISEHHPETSQFLFWSEMRDAINDLNRFMDETSLYRYCSKADLANTCLTDLLFELPDEMDDIYDAQDRDFNFDVDLQDLIVTADYSKLKAALIEVLKNSYDATTDGDTIQISAHRTSPDNNIQVTISNPGQLKEEDLFFDTLDLDDLQAGVTEPDLSNNNNNNDLSDSNRADITDQDVIQMCEPFFTTKSEHSGLGLSIVHKVCLSHNADLSLKQNGPQTEVSITFPAAS